jgi:phage-related protein
MATFTWTPDFGAKAAYKPRVRTLAFGDGYEQRQAEGINARNDTWDLQFQNRDNTETAAILSFLATRAGVEAFDWTPPNEASAIRVVCREWSKSVDKFNLNTVMAQFNRVYEP